MQLLVWFGFKKKKKKEFGCVCLLWWLLRTHSMMKIENSEYHLKLSVFRKKGKTFKIDISFLQLNVVQSDVSYRHLITGFLLKDILKRLSHITNMCRKIHRHIEKWEKTSILKPIFLFWGPYFFNLQFSLFIWKASGRKYTKSPCSTKFREMRYKI